MQMWSFGIHDSNLVKNLALKVGELSIDRKPGKNVRCQMTGNQCVYFILSWQRLPFLWENKTHNSWSWAIITFLTYNKTQH